MIDSIIIRSGIVLLSLVEFVSTADYTPLVPMSEFVKTDGTSSDWRALDCWQCFEAQGRMCH